MASSEQRDLEAVSQLVRVTTENLLKMDKASKGIAKNFAELAMQLQGQRKSMAEYIMQGIKLGPSLQGISRALVTPLDEMNAAVAEHKDKLAQATAGLRYHQEVLDGIRKNWTRKRAAQQQSVDVAQQAVNQAQKELGLVQAQLSLREQIHKWSGKEFAIEVLIVKGFVDAIKRSGELNQSLIEANSLTSKRAELSRDVWEVMAKTGNEQKDMLAAAKALTGVGFDMGKKFKGTLEVMVQMEEGLGVSYENSAQLARIFEVNLKTPVREVADKIAAIANQTSLAADEATRFATEIGKALRLLGPMQGNSSQVAGYMTMMAGRMKDVGGDASEVVKLFGEMTKGTAQGFMLRGLSGVNTPGALGGQPGAQAAMQGIDRMIKNIVSARPGTMAYTAQLEAASQIFGTSTETIRLWSEMMVKANEPLNEQQKLEARWREQITNANKALGRVRESLIALIQRGFNPLIENVVTPFLDLVAKGVSWIASNKVTMYATFAILTAGILKAIFSLGKLAMTLMVVARNAAIAAAAQNVGGTGGPGGLTGTLSKSLATQAAYGKILQSINTGIGSVAKYASKIPGIGGFLGKWLPMSLQTQYTGLGGIGRLNTLMSASNTRLWGLVGRLGMMGPVAAVAAAGAAGWAVGRWIDKKWPDNWIAMVARQMGEASVKAMQKPTVAGISQFQGTKSWGELAAEIREAIYMGREQDIQGIFEKNVHLVKGLSTERGAERMLEVYKEAAAQARERIGLASVTSAERETLDRDAQIIDLTKKGVEAQGGSKKLMEKIEADRKAEIDRQRREESLRYFREITNNRMLTSPGTTVKRNTVTISGVPAGVSIR